MGLEVEAQGFVGEPEGVVFEDHFLLDVSGHGIDEPLLAEFRFEFALELQ